MSPATPLLTRALICVAATCLIDAAKAQEEPSRDAVECHARGGVPNFLKKIEAKESLKVAYLGGSITAAPGWRVQSLEWFKERYPEAGFEEIHAAIGGTGSDLGVFRLEYDVLRHEPDLLFVEFAVNDGGASPENIHRAMEGIVRQTWKSDPAIDIIFVYTLAERDLPLLKDGKMQRSASAMEELADHYAIPSIHFGVEVTRLNLAGELTFTAPRPEEIATAKPIVFSTDGVHPHTETGHVLYTEAIARSWPAIVEASPGSRLDHIPGEPFRNDHWEKAKQVPITEAMLTGNWKTLAPDDTIAKRFALRLPQIHEATTAGDTLSFAFEGTAAAIFDVVGPDGGELRIEVDGADAKTANRVDAYCTYHRLSRVSLLSDGEPGRHEVTVTLTDTVLDKRSILFEKNRPDFDGNPEKYAPHHWKAGSILILGDLVE